MCLGTVKFLSPTSRVTICAATVVTAQRDWRSGLQTGRPPWQQSWSPQWPGITASSTLPTIPGRAGGQHNMPIMALSPGGTGGSQERHPARTVVPHWLHHRIKRKQREWSYSHNDPGRQSTCREDTENPRILPASLMAGAKCAAKP